MDSHVDRKSELPHFYLTPRDDYELEECLEARQKARQEAGESGGGSQKGLVQEWICGYMLRRQILGEHWHYNLQHKNHELLSHAFRALRHFERPILWGAEHSGSWSVEHKC